MVNFKTVSNNGSIEGGGSRTNKNKSNSRINLYTNTRLHGVGEPTSSTGDLSARNSVNPSLPNLQKYGSVSNINIVGNVVGTGKNSNKPSKNNRRSSVREKNTLTERLS